jgi:hypothetical protein
MRPIMSKEVRARLRYISVFTVQMIQTRRRQVYGTRRQISPISVGEIGVSLSLFGETRACMHWLGRVGDLLTTATACGRCADLRACNSSESLRWTTAGEPGITGDAHNMHACNHTKKFISYKSHFAMDAKYLIMANAVMPVGLRMCDEAKPVFAAINQ